MSVTMTNPEYYPLTLFYIEISGMFIDVMRDQMASDRIYEIMDGVV